MERNKQRQYSVKSIDRKLRTGEIRDDHPLQRMSMQHTAAIRDEIIASAISDSFIPAVIICEQVVGDNGESQYWLIDGKQRWTELAMFRRDQIRLGKNIECPIIEYNHVDEKKNIVRMQFDIRGKKYSDLPEELKERFDDFEITGDIFLQCTDEEIERYIRRFNNTKPMTAAQKGITYIGTEFARVVKRLSSHAFFKENIGKYTAGNARQGIIDRIITETIMMISYPDEFTNSQEKNCEFLRENAKDVDFNKVEEYLDRLVSVFPSGCRNENLTSNHTFLFLTLFDRIQKYGKDDDTFVSFIDNFRTIMDNSTHKEDWDEICSKHNTKDRSVVTKKLEILESLFCNFAEIKEEIQWEDTPETEELTSMAEFSSVYTFCKEEGTRKAVNNYLKWKYASGGNRETIKDDFELWLALFDDWTVEVNNNSKLFDSNGISAILAVIDTAISHDNDDVGKEWFIQFVEKYDNGFFPEWVNEADWVREKLLTSFCEYEAYKKSA